MNKQEFVRCLLIAQGGDQPTASDRKQISMIDFAHYDLVRVVSAACSGVCYRCYPKSAAPKSIWYDLDRNYSKKVSVTMYSQILDRFIPFRRPT